MSVVNEQLILKKLDKIEQLLTQRGNCWKTSSEFLADNRMGRGRLNSLIAAGEVLVDMQSASRRKYKWKNKENA